MLASQVGNLVLSSLKKKQLFSLLFLYVLTRSMCNHLFVAKGKHFNPCSAAPRIFFFENTVDPDQIASGEAI